MAQAFLLGKAAGAVGGPVMSLLLLLLMVRAVFVLLDAELGRAVVRNSWSSAGGPVDEAGGVGSRREFEPAGVALHPFVLFSAYRMNGSTLYVLGLVARLVRDQGRPAFRCEWHPAFSTSQRVVTRATLNQGETDWGKLPYTEVVLECKFPRDVGMDGVGGALHIVVKAAPQAGEVATQRVANPLVEVAAVVALREEVGYNFTAATAAPYRHKYAFCSAPISGSIRAEVLRPWLIYHLHVYQGRSAHFFLYNVGGLDARARSILKPFVDAGLVTVWDILEQPLYPAWWTSQILFMDDCVHRSRFLADWVVFHDFDEFVYVAPPLTLAGLLETHADAAMVTFGSWEIDVETCRAREEKTDLWPFYRMLWRSPRPECRDRLQKDPHVCIGSFARRKYVLNPRKEISVVVHYTLGSSYQQAVHLHASVARTEHYRGIFSLEKQPCSNARSRGVPVPNNPKRFSWSSKEMECALCPLVPQAMASVEALFNSTPQGHAFVQQLLRNSRTLSD